MIRPVSPGVFALVLLLLAGVWVAVAPFVLSIQTLGAGWLNSTINDVAVGSVLIGASLLGIVLHVAFGLRDLVSAATEADPGDLRPEPSPTD